MQFYDYFRRPSLIKTCEDVTFRMKYNLVFQVEIVCDIICNFMRFSSPGLMPSQFKRKHTTSRDQRQNYITSREAIEESLSQVIQGGFWIV